MPKSPPSLMVRAMGYLARREHSRAELERKLGRDCEDPAELERVLDDLQARGLLSEQRFIETVLHARRGKYGSLRIAHELREKGVSEAGIAAAVATARDDELATARAVWQRKFGEPAHDAQTRARQMRFLQSRGFALAVIRKVVQGGDE